MISCNNHQIRITSQKTQYYLASIILAKIHQILHLKGIKVQKIICDSPNKQKKDLIDTYENIVNQLKTVYPQTTFIDQPQRQLPKNTQQIIISCVKSTDYLANFLRSSFNYQLQNNILQIPQKTPLKNKHLDQAKVKELQKQQSPLYNIINSLLKNQSCQNGKIDPINKIKFIKDKKDAFQAIIDQIIKYQQNLTPSDLNFIGEYQNLQTRGETIKKVNKVVNFIKLIRDIDNSLIPFRKQIWWWQKNLSLSLQQRLTKPLNKILRDNRQLQTKKQEYILLQQQLTTIKQILKGLSQFNYHSYQKNITKIQQDIQPVICTIKTELEDGLKDSTFISIQLQRLINLFKSNSKQNNPHINFNSISSVLKVVKHTKIKNIKQIIYAVIKFIRDLKHILSYSQISKDVDLVIQIPKDFQKYLNIIKQLLKQKGLIQTIQELKRHLIDISKLFTPEKQLKKNENYSYQLKQLKQHKNFIIDQFNKLKQQLIIKSKQIKSLEKKLKQQKKYQKQEVNLILLTSQIEAWRKNCQQYNHVIKQNQLEKQKLVSQVQQIKQKLSQQQSYCNQVIYTNQDLKYKIKTLQDSKSCFGQCIRQIQQKKQQFQQNLKFQQQQNAILKNQIRDLTNKQKQFQQFMQKQRQVSQQAENFYSITINQNCIINQQYLQHSIDPYKNKINQQYSCQQIIIQNNQPSNKNIDSIHSDPKVNSFQQNTQIKLIQLNQLIAHKQSYTQNLIKSQQLIKDLKAQKQSQQLQIKKIISQNILHKQTIKKIIQSNSPDITLSADLNLQQLISSIRTIIDNLTLQKSQIYTEKMQQRSLRHNLQQDIDKLTSSLNQLTTQLEQKRSQINAKKKDEEVLLQNIQDLQSKNIQQQKQIQQLIQTKSSLQSQIKQSQQINKNQLQQILSMSQQKQLQNQQLQKLQSSFMQIKNAEKQRKKDRYKYFYQGQTCLDNSKQSFYIKQSISKQIQRLNARNIQQTCLLYKYSPLNKLQWTYFINKPQFVMIIRLDKQKIIAVYSKSPIIKPKGNQENKDLGLEQDVAFIFQSDTKGEQINFYPLLAGKSINGSFGNTVAFGKSDLRFAINDNTIEGNFGYNGTHFECNNKKIANLLGSTKVKMQSYQIYSLRLSEQSEVQLDHQQTQKTAPIKHLDRKTDNQFKNIIGYQEKLKNIESKYEIQIKILKETTNRLQKELQTQRNQAASSFQQLTQAKKENQHYLSKISELQRISEQHSSIRKDRVQKQKILMDLQNQIASLNKMYQHAVQQTQSYKSIENNLKNRIVHLQQKQQNQKQLTTSFKHSQTQISQLKSQINKLQKQLKQTKNQKETLKAQEEKSHKNKITDLQTQIMAHQETISNLRTQIQQLKYNLQGGTTQRLLIVPQDQPNQQQQTLKQQLSLLQQQHASNQTTIHQLKQQISQLTLHLAQKAKQISELLRKINQSEKAISELTHKLNSQSDYQQLKNVITINATNIEQLTIQNQQLKNTIQQLQSKIAQNAVLSHQPKNPKQSPSQTLKISLSAATKLDEYTKLCQTYQLSPSLIAHYDKYFQNQLLLDESQLKIRLVQHLELRMQKTFSHATLVFRYDPLNDTNFHKYIDKLSSLLCIVKTIHNVYIAGYYSGAYVQNQVLNKPACLISLNNNESYVLHTDKTSSSRHPFRGMIFNPYFIIYGNAQIRIMAKEKSILSNFGIAASFFNPRNKKVHDILGEGENREIEFESYEVYQVFFQTQQEQQKKQ